MRGRQPTLQDWRGTAELLADVSAAESVAGLVERVLPHLHRLFQSDLVIWDQFDGRARQKDYRMFPAADSRIAALQPVFLEYCHQHPFVPDWIDFIASGRIGVLSDRIATRDFLRTDLWREVYSHLHGKHQILFGGRIDVDRYWSLACNRLRRDFGSRERELARFLQPHLDLLFRRQARRNEAIRAADLLAGLFGQREAAYLIVEANGRVLEMSDQARGLLAKASGAEGSARRIKELLLADGPSSSPIGLSHRSWPGMHATVVRGAEGSPALILLSAARKAARDKRAHDLTEREEEIFHWLGEGKNNREISIVLGISPRTVEKHCERLFEKLGVETRLSAALLARRES